MKSLHTSIQDPILSEKIHQVIKEVEMFNLIDFNHNQHIQNVSEVANLMITDKISLVKWINLHASQLDVIFLTPDHSSKNIQEIFRLGVFDCILMPFDMSRLKKSLKKYCEYKGFFELHDTLTQSEIDLVHIDRMVISKMCVESTQNATCSSIYSYMAQNKNIFYTSTEVAEALKISRVTARKYMDCLESKKILSIDLSYGQIGRPKNKYVYKGD